MKTWKSRDVELDIEAYQAMNSLGHTMVLAGPGAGKTEILAQRASFLLETGQVSPPRKILAISFKSDAARNLEDRVRLRCGKELSTRFESRTYDSFAKNILDRFRLGLDPYYSLQSNYEIITDWNSIKEIGVINYKLEYQDKIWRQLFNKDLHKYKLPLLESNSLVHRMWKVLLQGSDQTKPGITFKMITRLAEYILRSNPLLRKALQSTYSHVFLDEFQDTTNLQYDLLMTAFTGSDAIMTAVGDNKQRIMGWADAMENSFENFEKDFNPKKFMLTMNYRSAPRLVEIQNVIAGRLDSASIQVKSPLKSWDEQNSGCQIWEFSNCDKEALYLASQVYTWINEEGLSPHEICILVKQTEHKYANKIINELSEVGIKARLEREYQDLMAEHITNILICMIEVAMIREAGKQRQYLFELYLELKKVQDFKPELIYQADDEFENFIDLFREELDGVKDARQLEVVLEMVIEFLGESEFKAKFPTYSKIEWLREVINKFAQLIWKEYREYKVWKEAIIAFKGEKSLPIMTIHKSKGLEYDTVFFIGVEDEAFWSFSQQQEEDTKSFFVAMSRAKRQMIFTYSHQRELEKFGEMKHRKQSIRKISELYNILDEAGVETVQLEKIWTPIIKETYF